MEPFARLALQSSVVHLYDVRIEADNQMSDLAIELEDEIINTAVLVYNMEYSFGDEANFELNILAPNALPTTPPVYSIVTDMPGPDERLVGSVEVAVRATTARQ